MHPEACSCDTTFGTNKEKKGLFTVAALDGNNTTFYAAQGFIPNEQGWLFHVLFKYCLPLLWGNTISSRMNLMTTDQNSEEYMALVGNTGKTVCSIMSIIKYMNLHFD